MNSKFLDLDKGRQDAVINASLKAFAINGYKRASTDDIVKSAGISKGLLFHYFESKKGLYEFLHDYSVKYMSMELLRDVKGEPGNIFLLQKEVEKARIQVMKKYPYMPTDTKLKAQWIKNLNIREVTPHLVEENLGKRLIRRLHKLLNIIAEI